MASSTPMVSSSASQRMKEALTEGCCLPLGAARRHRRGGEGEGETPCVRPMRPPPSRYARLDADAASDGPGSPAPPAAPAAAALPLATLAAALAVAEQPAQRQSPAPAAAERSGSPRPPPSGGPPAPSSAGTQGPNAGATAGVDAQALLADLTALRDEPLAREEAPAVPRSSPDGPAAPVQPRRASRGHAWCPPDKYNRFSSPAHPASVPKLNLDKAISRRAKTLQKHEAKKDATSSASTSAQATADQAKSIIEAAAGWFGPPPKQQQPQKQKQKGRASSGSSSSSSIDSSEVSSSWRTGGSPEKWRGAQEQSRPDAAEHASVWGYRRGDRLEVWSNSRGQWLPSIVKMVFLEDADADGHVRTRNTIKVESAAGYKYIVAEDVPRMVRQSQGLQRGATLSLLEPSQRDTVPKPQERQPRLREGRLGAPVPCASRASHSAGFRSCGAPAGNMRSCDVTNFCEEGGEDDQEIVQDRFAEDVVTREFRAVAKPRVHT